jgi:hypothetical protein
MVGTILRCSKMHRCTGCFLGNRYFACFYERSIEISDRIVIFGRSRMAPFVLFKFGYFVDSGFIFYSSVNNNQ